MFRSSALLSFALIALHGVHAQQAGTVTAETHPSLTYETCTESGCTTVNGQVTLDSNWRWVHDVTGYTNCYTGNTWDATLCPDPTTCATNCALDGADYEGTCGISATGSSLMLNFIMDGSGTPNVDSRVYLMKGKTEYARFNLKNIEFTFDVDISDLPCGLNGAVYFSQMDADGGQARFPTNKAGTKFGTGYCDSQCPQDIKFISGKVRYQYIQSSRPILIHHRVLGQR